MNGAVAAAAARAGAVRRLPLRPWLASLGRRLSADWSLTIGLGLFLLVCAIALLAPLLAVNDPLEQDLLARLAGPSAEHLMGTDALGRDIWARIAYGARVSLIIGLVSVGLAMVIGTALGVVSGYFGGWVDQLLSQLTNVLLAFPSLILGLMIVAMLGPSMTNLIWAIALATIPQFIRVARAPTMALRDRDYVQACRALGYRPLRIMAVHILPNIWSEILVMGTMWLATAIRIEASLAFIGLGVKPPTPSWGGMIREGFENILTSSSLAVIPSIAILLVVFALNLIGDGLRDLLDPRMNGSRQ